MARIPAAAQPPPPPPATRPAERLCCWRPLLAAQTQTPRPRAAAALMRPRAACRWIANLLPVQSAEKYALLSAETTRERLERELAMLSTAQGRCSVM